MMWVPTKAISEWAFTAGCALLVAAVLCLMTVQRASAQEAESSVTSSSAVPAASDAPADAEGQSQAWNLHVQSTAIGQGYPRFAAKYSGPNSLPPSGQARETLSLDVYAGFRLWKGAEAHVDVLSWQGFGVGSTFGIDDFPSGEAYKVGTRFPHLDIARLFIRQTIGLGGSAKEAAADDQLNLAGKRDVARLTLTVGRFSAKDVFDANAYANDPRKQFMNWALVASPTWDYPADSLGYTTGAAIELNQPKWTLRYGFFQIASQRNGYTAEARFLLWPSDSSAGDGVVSRSWAMAAEHERRYSVSSHPGAIRLLAYLNQGNFGSYQAALSAPGTDISLTHAYRRTYGFGLNGEQEITENIGVFSRVGWNDGQNEAWTFTDINFSASLGTAIKGEKWGRRDDVVGIAGVYSSISHVNQQFLAAGGTGILDGDGTLNYSGEKVLETYYDGKLSKRLRGAVDYQFVANPAFNRARGPVSIFGVRLHWEF